jgi:hypothetical protein
LDAISVSVSAHSSAAPYPQRAVYKGWGNVNDAANFECRTSPTSLKWLNLHLP